MRLSREQSKSLAKWMRAHHPASAEGAERAEPSLEELGFAVRGDECIEWGAARTSKGYGNTGYTLNGRWVHIAPHRMLRECFDGEAGGLDTLHSCSNKACINLSHTRFGDDRENALDRAALGETSQVGDTHRSAKLNRAEVGEMRELYFSSGLSIREVARIYGVGKSAAGKAIKGVTWRS